MSEYDLVKTNVHFDSVNRASLVVDGVEHLIETARLFVVVGRTDPWVEVRLRHPMTDIGTSPIRLLLPETDPCNVRPDNRVPSAHVDRLEGAHLRLAGENLDDRTRLIQWIQGVALRLIRTNLQPE